MNPAARKFRDMRHRLNVELGDRQDWTVGGGLFEGLRLPKQGHERYWSLIGPALVGCFEEEVQAFLRPWLGKPYDAVINVGAGEGYYLAGLGRLFPEAALIGYERDESRWHDIREIAAANGIADRVEIYGDCTPDLLTEVLAKTDRPLVIIDIEGAEVEFLRAISDDHLRHADLIIEAHDGFVPNAAADVMERLRWTHRTDISREQGRDPGANPNVRHLPPLFRWLIIWEGRSTICQWVRAEAVSAPADAAGAEPVHVLYHKKNTASVAPLAVLEELGLNYRLVTIDLAAGEHRQPDFLKVNPRGQVPAIQLPDGLVMTEAAAICLFLAEQHGRSDLVPATDDPQRAPFLEALVYLTNTIQAMYRRYYYPERHSTDPGDAPRIREKAVADLLDCWRSVDDRLAAAGPFHLGERYSLADLYMAMLVTWFPDQERLLDACPAVARCHAGVLDRPAVQRAFSF